MKITKLVLPDRNKFVFYRKNGVLFDQYHNERPDAECKCEELYSEYTFLYAEYLADKTKRPFLYYKKPKILKIIYQKEVKGAELNEYVLLNRFLSSSFEANVYGAYANIISTTKLGITKTKPSVFLKGRTMWKNEAITRCIKERISKNEIKYPVKPSKTWDYDNYIEI